MTTLIQPTIPEPKENDAISHSGTWLAICIVGIFAFWWLFAVLHPHPYESPDAYAERNALKKSIAEEYCKADLALHPDTKEFQICLNHEVSRR